MEQATGAMNPVWVAHLYLEKMKLKEDKLSQVLSGVMGRFDVHALRCSALLAFPSSGTLRAASAGGGGGFSAAGGGRPPWKSKKPYRANEVDQTEAPVEPTPAPEERGVWP